MSIRYALLALLSSGPKHGFQLAHDFEAGTGEMWPLNTGQVYTTLQRLERDGLVDADDGAEGPQNVFHLTDAGRRGGAWRKVKPVHTLDLVVIAVEWGHGRRQGWLSNLHLAARGAQGEWVMVGKTFKGLTDELLRWQTERFLELKLGEGTGRDGHVVYVKPEQVVEIALDGVQVSRRYPGGVALRFARVKRYRPDKHAGEADTIDRMREFHG
jgi:DNA-binding PadR family transcriptional regulator